MNTSDVALVASNALLGTAVGAGVDQELFVIPRWFASPPESLSLARERPPTRLFAPLGAGMLAGLVSALVLNRHDPARRRLLGLALGLHAATGAATAAYFAPEISRLAEEDSRLAEAEIERRGKRWRRLSWARPLALGTAWALTFAALAQRRRRRRLFPW